MDTPPPRLGEHTTEVLRHELDMTDAELTPLREAGIIQDHTN